MLGPFFLARKKELILRGHLKRSFHSRMIPINAMDNGEIAWQSSHIFLSQTIGLGLSHLAVCSVNADETPPVAENCVQRPTGRCGNFWCSREGRLARAGDTTHPRLRENYSTTTAPFPPFPSFPTHGANRPTRAVPGPPHRRTPMPPYIYPHHTPRIFYSTKKSPDPAFEIACHEALRLCVRGEAPFGSIPSA